MARMVFPCAGMHATEAAAAFTPTMWLPQNVLARACSMCWRALAGAEQLKTTNGHHLQHPLNSGQNLSALQGLIGFMSHCAQYVRDTSHAQYLEDVGPCR